MSESHKEITTEELMETIRRNIQQKIKRGEYSPQPPRFPEVLPYSMLLARKSSNKETYETLMRLAELPLEGSAIHSHRKFIGWIIVMVKKFFRFWTRKYTDPLFAQQTNFNYQLVEVLLSLTQRLEQLEQKLKSIEEKLSKNDKDLE